jgi:hypothetical protein
LGANLFNYLIWGVTGDSIFDTLIEEICVSRMKILFEYSIGNAIANCEPGSLPIPKLKTKELRHKLEVKDGMFKFLESGIAREMNGGESGGTFNMAGLVHGLNEIEEIILE